MEERDKNIKHQQDIFIKENIRLKIEPKKNLGNKNIIEPYRLSLPSPREYQQRVHCFQTSQSRGHK